MRDDELELAFAKAIAEGAREEARKRGATPWPAWERMPEKLRRALTVGARGAIRVVREHPEWFPPPDKIW